MPDLVPVTVDGMTIYIEAAASAVRPGQPRIREAGVLDAAVRALDTAQQLSDAIKGFSARAVGSFRELVAELRPQKATIEFGLSVSAEGNVYLVKSTGEASIKIIAEWTLAPGSTGPP